MLILIAKKVQNVLRDPVAAAASLLGSYTEIWTSTARRSMEKGRGEVRGLPGTNPIETILGRKRLDHIEKARL